MLFQLLLMIALTRGMENMEDEALMEGVDAEKDVGLVFSDENSRRTGSLIEGLSKGSRCTFYLSGFRKQAHLNGGYKMYVLTRFNGEAIYSEEGAPTILAKGHNGHWWFDDDIADFEHDSLDPDGVLAWVSSSPHLLGSWLGYEFTAHEWGGSAWEAVTVDVTNSCDGAQTFDMLISGDKMNMLVSGFAIVGVFAVFYTMIRYARTCGEYKSIQYVSTEVEEDV